MLVYVAYSSGGMQRKRRLQPEMVDSCVCEQSMRYLRIRSSSRSVGSCLIASGLSGNTGRISATLVGV